ncbi:LPD25 domain-containing protein [Ruminococcus callidus]|uniref:LPD25 domain-containing protein n=1 Tax=Ruminococcus callidus TaxID=40519 RepID=UPI003FD8464B
MREDTFRQIQEALDRSGLNYCAYSDGKNAMVAVNSSEVDRFRTVTGLEESLCRLQKSCKEHIPQDKNIIGNTDYKYIPQKTYLNDDRETILKMAELANKANISFSARIYPSGKAVMTVSQADMAHMNAIHEDVKDMRKPMIQNARQASQEIIGNKPYREIQNRQFMISPLTPERYHKIEPKLLERGAEFSGLIRDSKVMFTTEKENAPHFQAILRQTICEDQILENLRRMELNEPQIQALSSAIEIASRNNMANVIENYVSSDYDITQLGTMNELLVDYLNQSDTGQFLDNIEHLDRLMSAKQEFDLQIANREELLSDDEINLPEPDSISFRFGDQSKEWFTESDLLADFVQDNPEMSFALANAVLGYLDEKQHTERNIAGLNAGWYKKTDFTVTTMIDGQEFRHSGRFDIGDGAGTGGGTLIDHIEQFAKNALEQEFLYNENDRESLNYLLDRVVPFLTENAALTAEEQQILDDFKEQNPIRTAADVEITEPVQSEPPAIADSVAKAEDDPTEKTQNREPTDLDIAKQHIAEYLNREFGEPSEFSDMAKISLAYTTDEKHNLPILVYADLEQYRLVFEYDGNVVRDEQYDSLEDMNQNALSVLDFDDLVSLSDDEIASVIQAKSSDLPFEVGDEIEFQGKEWHIDSINENRGRIMLSRDTDNIIMPQEGLETFLSEVVEYVDRHADIENPEQHNVDIPDTADKPQKTEPKSDLPTFDVYIFDQESGASSPMRCQAKNTEEAKKIANEYIKDWNLVDAEITDIQLVEQEKELVKEKSVTVKSEETEISNDTPLFEEDVIADAGLGFVADDKERKPFGNAKQEYEQLTLFGEAEPFNSSAPAQTVSPVQYGEPIADVDRFQELHREIMRGSGFENGKFRIEAFFQENHPSTQEFADFLKNEYGTGGHTSDGNIFSVDHDSKGMQFTVRSKENGISNETFDFTWTEVAKLTADLIKHDKYFTQDEIKRRDHREIHAEIEPVVETVDEKTEPEVKSEEKSQNFTITDDNLGEGGAKTKFKNNLLAIQTLKQIESEDRTATSEEQEFLSKYVGWGGLSQAFDSENTQWSKEFAQLSDALTPEEYEAARKSVLDSFFTAPAIIDGIYEALEKFGFAGGNILEPSCGVGNFIGKMPSEIAGQTAVYGVEIDSVSGRIAKQLYPDADIQITGFENTNFQNGSFDVAVGNVPFGDLNFPDKQYGTTKLHDFFFAQTLDKVKEGGIVAFVTSKGTLDKKDESFRRQLAEKADLVGAVRLPNTAFKANAGTEVTSDILFLQKRSAPPEELPEWVHLGKTEDGLRVNSYFAENPEMVLGTIVEGNKLYGRNDDTMCIPIEGADLRQQIHEAVQKMDTQISSVKTNEVFRFSDRQVTMTAAELRPFSFFKDDKGDIYLKGGEHKLGGFDVSKVMDTKSKDYGRMTAFIDLRDTVRELLKVQADDKPENEIQAVQQKLSKQYDDFYKKYGLLHSRKNRQVLRDDCSYNLLLTLEKEIDKDKLVAKSDIFTKRTVRPSKPIDHVDTALEALAISMAETAKVDLAYMSKLTDMSQELLISELKGEIFLVPNTGEYQSASEYLSGDIRQKLDIAANFAETDSRFAENVMALEKAMPEPLKAGDIDVKIGATWIPKELYQQFMYELFQTPRENRADVKKAFWVKPKDITVDYSEHTNTWHIENKRADSSVLSRRDFGTKNMSAYEIMEQLLNLKEPKVYKSETYLDLNGNEKERRVVDVKATKIVQQKAAKIRQAFKDWIFKDPERAIPLVEQYNRQFNSIRPREYDGSALRFPGMNSAITLKEHQKNAIAHALFGGNTLFAHCVGAGKTFEMIATAMESKRLGLCTKPLFAVPNHLTEQIGEDFQKLYPGANILVATKNDFKKGNRQQLFSKIATGDFDAVIIGHSQLGMIPLSKERQVSILQDQIDDIMAGIAELKKADGSRFQVKQMERTKKSLEARLDKLEKSHDDILTFEEMGIDKLIVDEAHEFKNVPTQTKLTNVAGISSSASQKALDLFMKCRYLDEKTGSKGVIMATGTPLSNSVTELHTMMRFLEYDFLKDHGLNNFDNWVTVFGQQKTEWELAPAGNKFKERTRIANYTGLPELMSMFKQVADVRTADTLDLATPEMKYHIENIEATDFQKTLVQELSDRADDVQSGNVDPSVDNMLRITSDGRKLGLDPRLIDPSFEDNPDTKLNQCVRNVTQIYHDTAEEKLTQIIFCDLGVPKKNSQSTDKVENADEKSASERESLEEECDFCVYDDIRDKLIANGVKPEEIAYVHDAKTEQQKADLFDRVNKGEVRVLLGSTGKMGTGTNCQKKLIALHNLDIPWRPSDLQQRIGRIERQGNQNSMAHVFNYVTKGSFDAYLYQTLEAKQRFIGQIMTSKTPARTCEDVDQQALNYSEIKALCTGDERIKEKMMLDNEVKELNLLKAEHTNTVFDMQQTAATIPAKIEKAEIRLENLKADREALRQLPVDSETKLPVFKITIDGTEYTDRKEAAQAFEDVVLDFVKKSSDSEKEIGEFQGFKLSVKAVMFGNEPDIFVTMQGNAEHKCVLTSSFSANLKRMESTLYKIDQTISDAQSSINKLNMDLENARRILATPFPQQAELEQKTERLATLTDELNQAAIEAKKNAPEKQRTCYFERAKLKKEAFKDRQKPAKPKEKNKEKDGIE